MAILRQKRDEKGNMHKMVMFELGGGGGAKLHKKLGQKLLAISLCVTMVLLGAPATTFANEEDPVTSGQCGDNVTWNFDQTTKTLIISGENDMEDYDEDNRRPPWYYLRTQIISARIEGQAKKVSQFAFYNCNRLKTLTLASDTAFLSTNSLEGCTRLSTIELMCGSDYTRIQAGVENVDDTRYNITNGYQGGSVVYIHEWLHETIQKASCVEKGLEKQTCKRCGKDGKTTWLKTVEHSYTVQDYDDKNHYQHCAFCNKIGETKAHILETNEKLTNCNNEQTMKYKCTGCDYETEIISETKEHTPCDWKQDTNEHWRCCECCEQVLDRDAHAYDERNVCEICGYQKPKQNEPTSSDENKKPESTPTKPQKPETPTDDLSTDHSNWGTEKVYAKIKHYVDDTGKTSVEMSSDNLDKNSMLWLKEESYSATAWYGIDLSENAFDLDKGHRFYVQWLSPNDDDYKTYYSQLDDARKAEVEGNKGWIFLIGVENHENKTVQPRKPVKVYVQIGEDWDEKDLQGCYISSAQDEQVKTTFVDNLAYPAGTDTFGIMTLSHFSPYFIYDKLTDDEKAAFDALTDEEKTQLDAAAKELAAQQNDKSDEKSESKSEKNSSGSSAKTGDEIIYFTISGVSLMMTLALGLMLNSKINRRKLDE